MRALGIDLASEPRRTGFAVVRWTGSSAVVEDVDVGADDEKLLAIHARVDATGIDAPFGWSRDFVELVSVHRRGGGAAAPSWHTEYRDRLRFRVTDRVVRQHLGRWPLSGSSDLLAVPLFRCLGLLARMDVRDRSGDGRVFETYPAVALRLWGLNGRGYKGSKKRARLKSLVGALRGRTPWLKLTRAQVTRLETCDDAFDALVAALVARVAWLDGRGGRRLTLRPDASQREAGRDEGWIVLPTPDSLEHLKP